VRAVEELWPEADRQRCSVHRLRNILAKLPKREDVRRRVVSEIANAGAALGLEPLGSIRSPIRGARGNEEFLLAFRVN